LHEQATTLRDRVFLNLFDHFEQAYEGRLADEGKIDFEEMLLRANEHLERKAVTSDLRYILVDEFQDVSHLRMIFLELLRSHTPEARLFLVGDDWQSIYRFAGSDLNLFIDAESRLGSTARTDLDRTFRLESDILDVSTRFVTRNPSQLKKTLQARVTSGVPGVSVRYFEWGELGAALKNTLEDIAYRSQGDVSVLVLARYTHVLEDAVLDADWAPTDGATVKLHYSTVHRAKGLEADHVVVLSVESGTYGFPSEIHDDRVLRLVTHGEDDFENAEERRLFYVALTRTRGRAYVLAPANHPSGFVQELLGEDYSEAVEVFGEKSERFRCPLCHGMTIRQKSGKFGTFWSCIHHPRCKGRLRECDACHEGVLEPRMNEGRIVEFRCTGCEACVLVCPSCRTGALPRRMGSRGEFLACSNWRQDGSGCGYTRDA
jgi:DNA helicase-4